MAHLLSIPENVIIQHLFPCLDHNDLLRLRRVSKQTKAFANAYLWTPQPGHQGKWKLTIASSKKDKTLEAFLGMDVPPPSKLYIDNRDEEGPSEQRSFFEDEHLEEFMRRYSKYVTNLIIYRLFFPFTSATELGFYESLVNLKNLLCFEIITVGGAARFEEKTKKAEGSFLIRPTFKTLKIFSLQFTDCMDSMWNFVNGVSNNLDELKHPFELTRRPGFVLNGTNMAPVRELIERRGGMKSQSKLLYDWSPLSNTEPLELVRVFASCRDNCVMIKNLSASHLNCLLCDEDGWIDRDEVVDPFTGEWIVNSRVNYQRNLFVGSIIHSLVGVTDNVFLMDLPALEEIQVFSADRGGFQIRPRPGYGDPQWPNLRKMEVQLKDCEEPALDFLLGKFKRPKLEELCWNFDNSFRESKLRFSMELGTCCGNLRKLTIDNCGEDNDFFLGLWEGLPLLENVTLDVCRKLTNTGFEGTGVGGKGPAFLKLEKLKHLTLLNLQAMPGITDAAFRKVFRHLKLSSFKLTSDQAIKSITLRGIKALLSGPFAETIQQLDLARLQLQDVPEKDLKEVVSCIRSFKML